MNIIFFGSSKYVIPLLETLKSNFNISLVITTEKEKYEAVPKYCTTNEISYISVDKFDTKTIETIKNQNAAVAILAYFGLILPQEILSLFPKGIINIHPSLLPLYRGPTPVQTTLLNGDKQTGVTIIRLDEEVDHGPILGQENEAILPDDTTDSLHVRLFEKGGQLLQRVLSEYLKGALKPKAQNHEKATYTDHLTRQSGYIDRSNSPSEEKLQRLIRAYYPWPGVWTKIVLNGKETRMKLLPNQRLQLQDKRPMSYKDFYNGYPEMKGKLQDLLI